jgi:hypothetical protein
MTGRGRLRIVDNRFPNHNHSTVNNGDPTGTPQSASYRYPTSIGGTNVCAVLSPVLAFVFAPAGLVTGIVAHRQIRRTGEGGRGLALTGIIVSTLGIAFTVVIFLLAFSGIIRVP